MKKRPSQEEKVQSALKFQRDRLKNYKIDRRKENLGFLTVFLILWAFSAWITFLGVLITYSLISFFYWSNAKAMEEIIKKLEAKENKI